MNLNREQQNRLLGFLALYETSSHDGYLGAILITDLHGIPQEFRCTHPVKPTTIQKPLYGDTLQPYIGVNLCGIPLIESIQNKPSLIVVREEFLLDVRTASPYPVILIRRAGEVIDIETSDRPETLLKRERIDCSTGRFQPIVFSPHPDFDDDMLSSREILEGIFTYFDPLEPFERMSKAIEVLGKQDKRFQ
jgi:hypothetical protein